MTTFSIKPRQKIGKYKIERKLGEGGFAVVYQAMDTIEGVRVALKILRDVHLTDEIMEEYRKEVRMAAQLKHPNILPLKNADVIGGRFVIAYPLGEQTLADRLQSRMSMDLARDFSQQMISATAFAHEHRIIHCDIKPENLILFPHRQLMLTDFGIAKMAIRTIRASGSGTLGYCSPEQAMGKPSFRSDVFSLGLIMYRMFSGHLPEWPFEWPAPGHRQLRNRCSQDLVQLIRKAIEPNPRRRFSSAVPMLAKFNQIKSRSVRTSTRTRAGSSRNSSTERDWKAVRHRQFKRRFAKSLELAHTCHQCTGPIAECMMACPWCGVQRRKHRDATRFAGQCPRCHRGLKPDWHYCPWCLGAGFEVTTSRQLSDKRYEARCDNPKCKRKWLMRFMRYCPWCRRKVKRKWKLEGSHDRCPSCHWGVALDFWSYCPWCSKSLE